MTWWATFSPWALSSKRAIIEEEQQCGAVHEGICGLLSAGPSAGQTSITWLNCKVCSQAFLSRKILFHLAVCFTAYFKSGIIPGTASAETGRTLGMSVHPLDRQIIQWLLLPSHCCAGWPRKKIVVLISRIFWLHFTTGISRDMSSIFIYVNGIHTDKLSGKRKVEMRHNRHRRCSWSNDNFRHWCPDLRIGGQRRQLPAEFICMWLIIQQVVSHNTQLQ